MDAEDGSQKNLAERTFKFAVDVIKFLKEIGYSKQNEVIKYQVAKSSTSVGANYEESQGAYSKEDFKYKISICLKEAKETNYWLRIIKSAGISRSPQLDYLIKESQELIKIFVKSMKTMNS